MSRNNNNFLKYIFKIFIYFLLIWVMHVLQGEFSAMVRDWCLYFENISLHRALVF